MKKNQNTMRAAPRADYDVGYGKPPIQTRFKKGQSGNPNGRPSAMGSDRARRLALKEAYRPVTVREGDNVISLPAIQAVVRSSFALAVKGNGPAQRAFFKLIDSIERESADSADLRHEAEQKKAQRARDKVIEEARERIMANFDYIRN